jgi:F-type H+-transporting ATPase subunit b
MAVRPHQFLFATAALAAAAAPALAAKDSPQPAYVDLTQWLTALIVFGVVLVVLGKVVWPKITDGLDAREAKIRGEIEAAEQARKNADEALKGYEASLAEARVKAESMMEETRAEQSRMAARLKAESEAELNQMREAARRDIDAAKRAAVAEVYQEAATVAAAVAEKILQRELNEHDQQRLVEETLGEIGREYQGTGAPA